MTVNNYFANCFDASFGGFKNSGFGRDLGPEALDSFLEPKTIVWDFS
jgi:acyl-CoA reductase-like NAD-dependent aldehyde dehydrogenase